MGNKTNPPEIFSPNHSDRPFEQLSVSRVPIILWVTLIYLVAIFLQSVTVPMLFQSLFFTGILSLHIILYWFSNILVTKQPWIYFVIQAFLIFICAYVMPNSFIAVLIGLFPILIGQSVGVYYRKSKVLLVTLFVYTLFYIALIYVNKTENILLFTSFLTLNMIIVVAYAALYFQQVHARIRTLTFLRELERTHRQVEELTLANERQRMARDLHDTLAQGLAGLIMQLEAIDAHLSNSNPGRAQEIVLQSMSQARKTLKEARGAIDNLRSKSASDFDFSDAVHDEIRRFMNATGIHVSLDIRITVPLSRLIMEHGLHIISEGLTNVARHAQAQNVRIAISTKNDTMYLEIRDNGIGFNTNNIGKQPGHYGLLGMYERVRLIGGKLSIGSGLSTGTNIEIEAPLVKGDQ